MITTIILVTTLAVITVFTVDLMFMLSLYHHQHLRHNHVITISIITIVIILFYSFSFFFFLMISIMITKIPTTPTEVPNGTKTVNNNSKPYSIAPSKFCPRSPKLKVWNDGKRGRMLKKIRFHCNLSKRQ